MYICQDKVIECLFAIFFVGLIFGALHQILELSFGIYLQNDERCMYHVNCGDGLMTQETSRRWRSLTERDSSSKRNISRK